MSEYKPKKTIRDMSPEWHKDHEPSTVPDEWSRAVGIGDPKVPTPEDVIKAWSDIDDLNLVHSMVLDMIQAVAVLRACSETESLHRDAFRKSAPLLEKALENLRDAGKICFDAGLKLDSKSGE
jgi:hypothetical protein